MYFSFEHFISQTSFRGNHSQITVGCVSVRNKSKSKRKQKTKIHDGAKCTSWTKPWKESKMCYTEYSISLRYVWQVHICHSPIALSVIRFWTVWASCLSPVYVTVYYCWMLLMVLVAHSVGRSVSCTVVNIADSRLINDCHTLDTSTVWQLLQFFRFGCLHASLFHCDVVARARAHAPYFPIFNVNWALVIEILSQASLLRHVMDLLRQLSIPHSNERTGAIQLLQH